jgi:hypothetical protein
MRTVDPVGREDEAHYYREMVVNVGKLVPVHVEVMTIEEHPALLDWFLTTTARFRSATQAVRSLFAQEHQ